MVVRDLGDGLGQGRDAGFPGILGLVLIGEAVAEDDGIVDGQGQLQNHGDRVGDEGDGTAQKVGAHVEHRRGAEGQQQHRHLGVGPGGQGQHHHDDDRRNDEDGAHLTGQVGGHIPAHLGINVAVLPCQGVLDALNGPDAHRVGGGSVKGHRVEGGGVFIMFFGVVKRYTVDAVHPFDGLLQGGRRVRRHIGYHDPGRAEGGKVIIHHRKTLAGLGVGRQIGGDVVFHFHPARCHNAEDQRQNVQQKEKIAFVHNKGGNFLHSAGFRLLFLQGVLPPFHRKTAPSRAVPLSYYRGCRQAIDTFGHLSNI